MTNIITALDMYDTIYATQPQYNPILPIKPGNAQMTELWDGGQQRRYLFNGFVVGFSYHAYDYMNQPVCTSYTRVDYMTDHISDISHILPVAIQVWFGFTGFLGSALGGAYATAKIGKQETLTQTPLINHHPCAKGWMMAPHAIG